MPCLRSMNSYSFFKVNTDLVLNLVKAPHCFKDMKSFLNRIGFYASLSFMWYACSTPYQPLTINGGYRDHDLGEGKYKIFAEGKTLTSPAQVRAIAYTRAAEIAKENGKPFFFIVMDNLETEKDYHPHGYSYQYICQLIIQPTKSSSGLDVNETILKYKNELKIKKKSNKMKGK